MCARSICVSPFSCRMNLTLSLMVILLMVFFSFVFRCKVKKMFLLWQEKKIGIVNNLISVIFRESKRNVTFVVGYDKGGAHIAVQVSVP